MRLFEILSEYRIYNKNITDMFINSIIGNILDEPTRKHFIELIYKEIENKKYHKKFELSNNPSKQDIEDYKTGNLISVEITQELYKKINDILEYITSSINHHDMFMNATTIDNVINSMTKESEKSIISSDKTIGIFPKDSILNPDYSIYILKDGKKDELIGICQIENTKRIIKGKKVSHIHIMLFQSFIGKGFGTKIYDTIEQYLKKRGRELFPSPKLTVNSYNLWKKRSPEKLKNFKIVGTKFNNLYAIEK